jgi:general secretion pathway protein I
MAAWHCGKRRGFTLVEVLVALAIVSVALLSALRAAGQGTNSVVELRSRLLASWVAEDRLAQHHATGEWLPLGVRRGTARQAGMDFTWREEVISTPNAYFRRVEVRVYPGTDESHSLAHLVGFIVNAPRSAR